MMEANTVVNDCQGARARAQSAAAELYQLAALLVGDEHGAGALVEATVARTEVDPCADAEASVKAAQLGLVESVVRELRRAAPDDFEAPPLESGIGGCIEGDDASAGALVSEPRVLRDGLNKLPPVQRIVFVVRAILGWDNESASAVLQRAGCNGWKAVQVGEVFRRALCSVSTSLVEAKGR